jgi:putative alpha-1,2-mannosidase
LSRVDVIDPGPVSGFSTNNLITFYTALWRGLTFPRRIDEIDKNGNMVHYSPYSRSGGIFPGPLVTDNGFWDTFRSVYPMLSLLYPDKLGIIIQGDTSNDLTILNEEIAASFVYFTTVLGDIIITITLCACCHDI